MTGASIETTLEPAVFGTAGEIAQDLDPVAWHRLQAGDGTKEARLHDWASLELAEFEASDYSGGRAGVWTCGLLIRRHIADGQLAFSTTWCPAGTGIDALVQVWGHRWAAEDRFETAKNELGLDTTRPVLGMAGIATFRWSRWLSPRWR